MLPDDFQPHYLNVALHDDVVVASFELSQLTDDDNVEILGRELFALVDQYGCMKLVVDLSGVMYVTSSVLGKIITLHRKIRRSQGELVLCNLEPGVIETLETSRLINYFSSAADIDAAIAQLDASC